MSDLARPDLTPADRATRLGSWLNIPERAAARMLFRALRRDPRERTLNAVVELLAFLSNRSTTWDSIINKSLTRKGRCPRPLRGFLRRELERQSSGPRPTVAARRLPQIYQPTRIAVAQRTRSPIVAFPTESAVRLTNADTAIEDFPQALLSKLAAVQPGRRGVLIDCDDAEHCYVFGLALLAVWARATRRTLKFRGGPSSVRDYIERFGVTSFADGLSTDAWHDDLGWSVPLQAIRQGESVDRLVSRLARIFEMHAELVGSNDQRGLKLVLSELIENIGRHAGDFSAACVGAQFFPQKRKLSIVIADSGMGIRNSFLAGDNLHARRRLQRGESPLAIAIQPLQTSKYTKGHSGYGLYLAGELAVRNSGTFRITSGDQSLSRFPRYGRVYTPVDLHSPWKGTIVSLIFDLNQTIPYEEVYLTLPIEPGYVPEDYFA